MGTLSSLGQKLHPLQSELNLQKGGERKKRKRCSSTSTHPTTAATASTNAQKPLDGKTTISGADEFICHDRKN
jgi:hypothetical protein